MDVIARDVYENSLYNVPVQLHKTQHNTKINLHIKCLYIGERGECYDIGKQQRVFNYINYYQNIYIIFQLISYL